MTSTPTISPKPMKRSGVKEMITALESLGVNKEDIVIERAPDGTVRVYQGVKEIRANKLTPLQKWEAEHGKTA